MHDECTIIRTGTGLCVRQFLNHSRSSRLVWHYRPKGGKLKAQHAAEVKELKSGHTRAESDLQKRLDAAESRLAEAGTRHATELQEIRAQHAGEMKTREATLTQARREASDAREAKAAMTGELKALKSHNDQLAVLLAGKTEPAAVKAKK